MKQHNENEKPKRPVMDAALLESLSFDHQRVSIIRCNPTSRMFIFWFHVSCYFPVLTACLGPIGNTISIVCVIEKWRIKKVFENDATMKVVPVSDPTGIFVFNVISLVLGFVSNMVLLLHFGEKLSYLKAQWISMVGWTIASIMLLIDVIVCGSKYLDEGYEKSIGFWYAAITSGLYFGCTVTLSTHFIGYTLGKYPARFNLIKNERSLMVFTVSLSVILIWGAGMFSGMLHVSFGNSLYFCVVSILTVGLGDLLPISVAARILVLVYSTLGVVNLALIVAVTTKIFRSSSGSVIFFHNTEKMRRKELRRIEQNEVSLTPIEAFDKMQSIRRSAHLRQRLNALFSTLLAFIVFWLLGSLGFKFAENWSYFSGMYFCFLCLLTIGYGDYAPASGAGRAFFVIWALGAVPMMSAILSTVGDLLLDLSESMDMSIARKFKLGVQTIVLHGPESWNKFILNDNEIFPEDDSDDQSPSDGLDDEESGSEMKRNTSNHSYSNDFNDSKFNTNISQIGEHVVTAQIFRQSRLNEAARVGLREKLSINSVALTEQSHDDSSQTDDSKDLHCSELQRLLKAIKDFRSIAKENRKYSLTYKQWNELSDLNIFSLSPDIFNDPKFWLSEYSPLRFPLDQPKFIVMRLFTRIEQILIATSSEKERELHAPNTAPSESALRKHGWERFQTVRSSRVRSYSF